MKTLLLVRGLPGSGKSTFARSLWAEGMDWQCMEADDFFFQGGILYNFDPTKLKEAHSWCQKEVGLALADGFNVVVSNTFSQFWEVGPYALLAKRLGVNLQIIELKGGYKNIHNVPEDKIQAMKDRWEPLESILEKCSKI